MKNAHLTPDTCVDGELCLEQSSELEEEVEVGVIGTALLLAVNTHTHTHTHTTQFRRLL